MRHFTLASLAATALTLGLLTASPSMAQTAQPAAKSDKMAPAPKAPAADSKMAPAAKTQKSAPPPKAPRPRPKDGARRQVRSARHQFRERRTTRRAAGNRQGLFRRHHQGPPLQGQGRAGA